MWLTIVLERHLLPRSNVKIRFNAPSPRYAFQQRECTWKNFYSARIKFSPRMLSRFCFPAGFSPGSWRRVFFLVGSRRVQISRRDSCRDMRREFFPGRILPGKRATLAGSRWVPGILVGSRRDPGTYFARADTTEWLFLDTISCGQRVLEMIKGKTNLQSTPAFMKLILHSQLPCFSGDPLKFPQLISLFKLSSINREWLTCISRGSWSEMRRELL